MSKRKVLLTSVILLITCACGMFEYSGCGPFDSRFCSPDPFYQSSGEIDSLRVPLLEPYEAIKIDDSGWFIELDSENLNDFFYFGINAASKIAIMENRIYVYSDYERPDGINIDLKKFHWFVLDVVNETENAFETEEEFLQYQQDNGYEVLEWMTLDDVFKEFEATGCLPWVPGCIEDN